MKIGNLDTITIGAFEPKEITLSKDDRALKEQTDNFEAFMIKKILDISIKRENTLFGKDPGDKIYNSMYNDTISKALSGGLGYSQLLFDFLKENNQK